MPAQSKDPSIRARRNKTTTRATLTPQTNPKVPPLPTGTRWYPQVRDWWKRAWSSPMVPEWTESDVDALYLAAKLQQQFWDPETTPNVCRALASEIRQLLAQCGLTPMSRRALQWEIERAEAAQENTTRRRAGATPTKAPAKKTTASDPRARFKVVNGG
jgi:hypothetical protein